MCNLYSMTRNREAILRLFRSLTIARRPTRHRGCDLPRLPSTRRAQGRRRRARTCGSELGLRAAPEGQGAHDASRTCRDDQGADESGSRQFEQRRCLVPASSYSKPKGEKPATWHSFSINGDDARPVFAFPGVWIRYKGPLKKNGDGVEQDVAFMTTEPTSLRSASTTSACRCCRIPPTSRRGSRVLRMRRLS